VYAGGESGGGAQAAGRLGRVGHAQRGELGRTQRNVAAVLRGTGGELGRLRDGTAGRGGLGSEIEGAQRGATKKKDKPTARRVAKGMEEC